MKKSILFMLIVSLMIVISSCGDKTDVVESGIYSGKIKKIESEKTEIYVTLDDGKTLELYFTEATTLTKNGQTVKFSELATGQKVEVDVKKIGKRLDPISVKIKD